MAEWMALDPRLDARRLARARALGRAVGTVVWVVDDAKDVWRDLEAGRPNLFLMRAALAEPALFGQGASGTTRDGLFDLRLIQTWERTRAISTVCRRSVRTLRSAATRTRAPAAARRELLGQLGAAMACW